MKAAKLRAWVESEAFQRALLIGLCSPFFTDHPHQQETLAHRDVHQAKARRVTAELVALIESRPS